MELHIPSMRKVCFSEDPISRTEYVETRKELHAYKEDIWYKKENFVSFRNEAIEELRDHMHDMGFQTPGQTITSLYQP